MTSLRSFGDIMSGAVLPELAVVIDRAALIRFAGAADDYVPQHWDHPFMIAAGYSDVIVHGWLVFAHMTRAVTDWVPPEIGHVADYSVRYRRPFYPGTLLCGGEVVAVEEDLARLTLWARDEGGAIVTTAETTLVPAVTGASASMGRIG
ncbi:MaoC family dehydratase [Sphingobium sp.]|uniref:MaoC family dehydratase n=1 Tax=Sphingobium sp. TaxID=1912891 RepID=UPI002C15C028|nr:MaoC/PaaZ C-terminal domain-containing protein [Sphingobium sp.]HUD92681.1 MaoC/PaaZ C-terminal domain-containing protein [Sphingobium sp.]